MNEVLKGSPFKAISCSEIACSQAPRWPYWTPLLLWSRGDIFGLSAGMALLAAGAARLVARFFCPATASPGSPTADRSREAAIKEVVYFFSGCWLSQLTPSALRVFKGVFLSTGMINFRRCKLLFFAFAGSCFLILRRATPILTGFIS